MGMKKSQLYSSIWQGCDELRGGMDASQYKDYVLVLLFVRYVSDKYAGNPHALVDIPKGGSFADMQALVGKANIGEGINKVLSALARANNLEGVIDAVDFNDDDKLGKGKDMVDRLSSLINIFSNPDLDFSKNRAEGDDLMAKTQKTLRRKQKRNSSMNQGRCSCLSWSISSLPASMHLPRRTSTSTKTCRTMAYSRRSAV
jgi:type I restriction enzyme M protein